MTQVEQQAAVDNLIDALQRMHIPGDHAPTTATLSLRVREALRWLDIAYEGQLAQMSLDIIADDRQRRIEYIHDLEARVNESQSDG